MNALTRTLIRILLAGLVLGALSAAPAAAKPRRVTFGAWTPGSPFGGALAATNQLEGSLQRRVKIVSWYQDWSVDESHFRWNVTKAIKGVRRSGRTPMLTWEPFPGNPYGPGPWDQYSNDAIISGAHDDYIRWWASKISRLGKVYVRFAHEMNGTWYSWGGPVNNNSQAKYVAMWRHVVDVARSAGATNIKWVWCPLTENVPNTRSNRFQGYYPGRAYVDVLALDGYNWGGGTPEYGGWRSFRKIFASPYKRLRRLGNQPIWIAEVGSSSDGGDKNAWVRSMFRTAARWKRLKAIVWFNQDGGRDWSTASAASAFKRR